MLTYPDGPSVGHGTARAKKMPISSMVVPPRRRGARRPPGLPAGQTILPIVSMSLEIAAPGVAGVAGSGGDWIVAGVAAVWVAATAALSVGFGLTGGVRTPEALGARPRLVWRCGAFCMARNCAHWAGSTPGGGSVGRPVPLFVT